MDSRNNPRRISQSQFVLAANGIPDSTPVQPLREYLLACGAPRVTTILHPLTREGDTRHRITAYRPDAEPVSRRIRLPVRPPYTYPLDVFVPVRAPVGDCWFGFNSLACARGLLERAAGRTRKVVYWCIDFVPNRFGRVPATKAYDWLDRACCRRADARFELSHAGWRARERHHGFEEEPLAPTRVVPIGAWVGRVPKTSEDGFSRGRVIYLGTLRLGQGVPLLLDALALLRDRGVNVEADIIGGGPLEGELKRKARAHGLDGRIRFHGFVSDHSDVDEILASASVAAAPYEPTATSFTRFADPGKLKSYAAAGLPIVMTNVPPNAPELEAEGAAEITPFSAPELARAIEHLLDSPDEWRRRRAASLTYAQKYDWPAILEPALGSLGFVP
jgi:glycosyltransferase involved in cell wall biosynthesis